MRTTLLYALRRAFLMAQYSHQHPEQSLDDVLAACETARQSRRRFLKTGAQAGVLMGLGTGLPLLEAPLRDSPHKIAVVGAGIGGLSTAWYLRKWAGWKATIYEADKRPAGRIKSVHQFDNGRLYTEFGAEFIDTNHKDLFRLMREFGLKNQLMDLEDDHFGSKEAFYIEDQRRSVRDIVEELNRIYPVIIKDQGKRGTPGAEQFDQMSIAQYLESLPISPWVKKLLNTAFLSENGQETDEQSAWNFLDYIEPLKDQFKPYGSSDERYKIKGGNDQLPRRMAEKMKDQLRYEHRLIALKERSNGSIQLVFDQNGSTVEAVYDAVILTIPFTILRQIDLQMELPPLKQRMIRELAYGSNTKFILETRARSWRRAGFQGNLFNEYTANGWDSSQMQQNNEGAGTYSCLFGGKRGVEARKGTEAAELALVMPPLENIFPGMKADLSGNMELVNWPSNPFVKASYSSYGIGQHSLFKGVGRQPVRRLFFAGEHCSDDFWGFMNGAAETGRLAAKGVISFKS